MTDGPYRATNVRATWRVVGPRGFDLEVGGGGFGEQRANRLVEQLNAAYVLGVESAMENCAGCKVAS